MINLNNMEINLKIQVNQASTLREANDIVLAIKRFPNVSSVLASFGDVENNKNSLPIEVIKRNPDDRENIERNFANES